MNPSQNKGCLLQTSDWISDKQVRFEILRWESRRDVSDQIMIRSIEVLTISQCITKLSVRLLITYEYKTIHNIKRKCKQIKNLQEISGCCSDGNVDPSPIKGYNVHHTNDGQHLKAGLPVLEHPCDGSSCHQYS